MRCITPVNIVDRENGTVLQVRCGRCLPCKMKRSSDWAFRLRQHNKGCKNNYFVTLTLSDENITWAKQKPTLNKRDVQLFFKRFRKLLQPTKITYYAVGEYGSKSLRPHYHILLFNTEIDNSRIIKILVDQAWKNGFVHVGNVTDASIRYIAGYMDKHDTDIDEEVLREFNLQSTGIGKSYCQTVGKWHKNNKKFEYLSDDNQYYPLPRYYKKKIFNEVELSEYSQKIRKEILSKFPTVSEEAGLKHELIHKINRYKQTKKVRR